MADAYQPTGSAIGALLRQIREDQANSPTATPPGTDINSPIRGLVQQPLSQVESPESAHVITTRPEVSPVVLPGSTATPGGTTPSAGAPSVVPPVAPVVPPTAPGPSGAPTEAPSGAPTPSGSASPSFSPSSSSAPAAKPISLATRIGGVPSPAPKAVLGASTAKPPTPTPTPAPARNIAPGPSRIGGAPILSTGASLATKILPDFLSNAMKFLAPIVNLKGAQQALRGGSQQI